MANVREIICEYQPYVDRPPVQKEALYGQACSNDKTTVTSWRETWLKNIRANKERFGSFKAHGVGQLFGKHNCSAAVLVGSGPSLKGNAAGLKKNPGAVVVSCLHNFHYLEDLGVGADYYVSLDAGPVTIEEVSEGGKRSSEEYWQLTESKTLVCYIATDPELLRKWRGKIYFFNCPIPDESLIKEIDEIETFNTFLSTGGNVLGACTYLAKGILGCFALGFLGADFSFSYLEKFHGWDSKYDKSIGHCIRMTDVYGNSVKTWQSYANFKAWFDWLSMQIPGVYFNCTEGGTFGAYPGGNLRSVTQMDLADFFRMLGMHEELRDQCENPETKIKKILF